MLRRLARPVRRSFTGLLLLAALIATAPSGQAANAETTPDAALHAILAAVRAQTARSCARPVDRLAAVVCAGTIRVGVRDNYPPFAVLDGQRRLGFEVDVARHVAAAMGVTAAPVTVTPADRIALLAENRIDLTIATMGDTTLRDGQARFIRPHYYASYTAVVGLRAVPVTSLQAVAGHTVCVTVGDSSNPELAAAGARLLLFASPEQLIDELHAGACSLVAQDDTFFARYVAEPRFNAAYDTKFTMDPLPWGMAAPQAGGERLATVLSLISEIFHRDGVFLTLAKADGVPPGFLPERRAVWLRRDCDTATGFADPRCVLPPRRSDMAQTAFAVPVSDLESWVARNLGLHVSLAIFKLRPAWDLVREGIRNSVILILGTLLTTFVFALLVGRALSAKRAILRLPVRAFVMLLQSTPPVLSLVIAASAANAIFTFSAGLALSAAILALGLINGSNAGQAISEAVATLRAEAAHRPRGYAPLTERQVFVHALRRSITQIIAFLVNATKATPIASFIGAPELLNALTDSTSFASDRETTYWLLLVFYLAAVLLVVRLCGVMRGVLERRIAAA